MQINKIISFSGIEILIIQKCDLLIITNNVNVGWKLCSKVLTLKVESVKNITSLKMAVIFCHLIVQPRVIINVKIMKKC